jgi:hypothetical protein
MKNIFYIFLLISFSNFAQNKIPHIKSSKGYHQLIVEGKPFIILGAELGNSTATTIESMEPVWPVLKAMNLNTFLMPVY